MTKICLIWPGNHFIDSFYLQTVSFHALKRERARERKNSANKRESELEKERSKRWSASEPNADLVSELDADFIMNQTPIQPRTKRRSSQRTQCRFCPTAVMLSLPHCRSFMVVRSLSFRKTHGEFSFHLWPIRPPIHTSPYRRCTVTEPHLRKTHKSNPHTSWIRCAFYIYIYIFWNK